MDEDVHSDSNYFGIRFVTLDS